MSGAAALLVAVAGGGPAGADRAAVSHPVVVELFTSQGCSTCPPADLLIGRLARESRGRVVPLAFHVDSWNHQGWSDPFSSSAWTRRHAAYVRALRAEGAYTPQAVVDGSRELLGSDAAGLEAAIREASLRPAGEVRLALEAGERSGVAHLEVSLPPALREAKLDLVVALFESDLETPVRRGENGGKVLRDDCVVRTLLRAAKLRPEPAREALPPVSVELQLDPGWRTGHLGVAAFLQDPRTLTIHGAASASWPKRPDDRPVGSGSDARSSVSGDAD